MAGIRAGLIYNTWPLMAGAFIPDGLLKMSPLWHNFFENHLTVQFQHRIAAYLLLALAAWHAWSARKSDGARGANLLVAAVVA